TPRQPRGARDPVEGGGPFELRRVDVTEIGQLDAGQPAPVTIQVVEAGGGQRVAAAGLAHGGRRPPGSRPVADSEVVGDAQETDVERVGLQGGEVDVPSLEERVRPGERQLRAASAVAHSSTPTVASTTASSDPSVTASLSASSSGLR